MAKSKRKKIGLPPGSIIFTGKRKVEQVLIHYLEFNETQLNEKELSNDSIESFHEPVEEFIQWYDIRGLHHVELIEEIGKVFKVHSLALEDIVDINQRPKFEEYQDGLFVTCRALHFDPIQKGIKTEHVALFFGNGFVLSFQENADDLFTDVRKRIQNGRGRIRKKDASYLAYSILDSLIDRYFLVLDEVESSMEKLELQITQGGHQMDKSDIHNLKQEMLIFRKTISPTREAISKFSKSDHSMIEDSTQIFVRDLYDHTVQIMDIAETYRDTLNGLQDLYISEISLRMNQVMQVLTIVTTIFVPLSFLAGLYGMNFENIPELRVKYGYFILLGIMLTISISMLIFFKRKKWF